MIRSFLFLSLLLLPLGFAQTNFRQDFQNPILKDSLDQALTFYETHQFDGADLLSQIENGTPIALDLLGILIDVKLEPIDLRSSNPYMVTMADDGTAIPVYRPVRTYRGNVDGIPDSDVALLITEDLITGTVRMEEEVFFLQPAQKFNAKLGTDTTVIYRDADVRDHAKASCGMEYLETASEKLLDQTKATYSVNPKVVQIALDTDGEFVQAHPSIDVHDLLENYVNQLDVIWRNDLNLQLEITAIIVRPNPSTDPWTNTIYGHGPLRFGQYGGGGGTCQTPGDGLWEQFSNYWNSNGSFYHDIMVLFVGRDMKLCPTTTDPTTYELFGTAGALGTVCRYPDRAYVVMEEYTVNTVGLMAHEIGHSLNGIHVNSSDCNPGPPIGPVLCGTVEPGSDYYAASNITRITNFLNTYGSCLGEEIHFPITADTYVLPQWPNNNYGANNYVWMRTGPSGYIRKAYFKFTVSGLTSTISSAKMRALTGPVAFPSITLSAVKDTTWGEYTITWNNAPPFGFSMGASPGLPASTWVDINLSPFITGNGVFTVGAVAPDIPNLYFRTRHTPEAPTLIIKTND